MGRRDRRRRRSRAGRDRDRRPAERRQVEPAQRAARRGAGDRVATSRARPATRSTRALAWGRSEIVLIDTAGIKRRGKVASGPAAEKYSTLRALKAIGRADVAILVIDAVEGLTAQDAHVAGYVVEEGKGLVVAINKWDLVAEKTDKTFDQYVEWIRHEVPFLDFAPVISVSAKTGQRVGRRPRGRGRHLGRAPPAHLDGRAEPGPRRGRRSGSCRRSSRAAGRRSSTRPRRPSRRRRSCSSPTTPARSTSATGATSRTGCARRSASTARRSGSCSATGAPSSCRGARRPAPHRAAAGVGSAIGAPVAGASPPRPRRPGSRRTAGQDRGKAAAKAAEAEDQTAGQDTGQARDEARSTCRGSGAPDIVTSGTERADRATRGPARVAVVGAGAWGTTLAILLGRREPVDAVVPDGPRARHGSRPTRRNEPRLPGVDLSAGVRPTADPAAARGGRSRHRRRAVGLRPRDDGRGRRRSCGRSPTSCRSSRASSAARSSG